MRRQPAPLPERADPAADVAGRALGVRPVGHARAACRAPSGRAATPTGTQATASVPSTETTSVLKTPRRVDAELLRRLEPVRVGRRDRARTRAARSAMPARSTAAIAGVDAMPIQPNERSVCSRMTDQRAVTMDKIVSLCRRRGFVFPSSEIYGGLGSTYDYGHYGVLTKNNIRSLWFQAMVQERDDIVALDSAVILNPRVWEASGHVAGFSDPLVDCRTCKLRFRADRLEDAHCGKQPSKRPGEHSDCDLTEARQFNLMFQTQVGAMEDASSTRVPPPGDRAGHLHQLQERAAARAPQAAVRHRAGRQVVPQRDHAGQLPLPRARVRADGDGVLRAARRGATQWYRYWVEQRLRVVPRSRAARRATCASASTRRRSARTTRAPRATSSTSTRSAGRSSRASRTAATTT